MKCSPYIAAACLLASCASRTEGVKGDPIGSAEMKADGTIVLDLRAESPGGYVGHGYYTYSPSHPEYQEILAHVGPLSPGKSVIVHPWPEQQKRPNKSPEPTPTAVTPRATDTNPK